MKLSTRFSKYVLFVLLSTEECMLAPYGALPGTPKTIPGGCRWTFKVTDLDGKNEREIIRETGSKYGQGAITTIVDGLVGRTLSMEEAQALDTEELHGIAGKGMIAEDFDSFTGQTTETITGLERDRIQPKAKTEAKTK